MTKAAVILAGRFGYREENLCGR